MKTEQKPSEKEKRGRRVEAIRGQPKVGRCVLMHVGFDDSDREQQTLEVIRNLVNDLSHELKQPWIESYITLTTFMESLILAQDERWRRA